MKKEHECPICSKITKNKVYCSVKCQGVGCRGRKSPRVNVECLYCRKSFEIIECKIKEGKGKYCSRKCTDLHKKETYLGNKNPMYGKTTSDLQKAKVAEASRKLWESEEFRDNVKKGQEETMKRTGYWPGTDPESIKKKKKTYLKNFGVDHNWKNKESREKCETTCVKKYGRRSIQIAFESLNSNRTTKIEEKIKHICEKNNLLYKSQYRIYYNNERYRMYDFYLYDYNLLIEADGDYWHANPDLFNKLNETQERNRKNDRFKEELAEKNGFCILRFWETDIRQENFEEVFLEKVYSYGKKV